MNKINKKILNNVNLEQPSETVLCDAKNYMEKNKYILMQHISNL